VNTAPSVSVFVTAMNISFISENGMLFALLKLRFTYFNNEFSLRICYGKMRCRAYSLKRRNCRRNQLDFPAYIYIYSYNFM
jgi:hypothetical protein